MNHREFNLKNRNKYEKHIPLLFHSLRKIEMNSYHKPFTFSGDSMHEIKLNWHQNDLRALLTERFAITGDALVFLCSHGVLWLALNDLLIKAGPPLSGLIMLWGSEVSYRAAGGQSSCSMLIVL